MRLLISPQIFDEQKFGGISRYYTEIFTVLAKENQTEIIFPIHFTNNIHFKESGLYKTKNIYFLFYTFLNIIGISVRKKTKRLNNKFLHNILKDDNFDLFIPTYYSLDFLSYINSKPYVLTVYDMIHELFPESVINGKEIVRNKLVLIENASKIIAVSQNTKRDIIRLYPHIEESKIEVIYHGNSIKIDPKVEIDLPENYILFVGVRQHYKNFIFLIESIFTLFEKNPDLVLICAGGGKFSKEEKKMITSLGLENRIIQRYFKDNELGTYYNKAKCFVFPSEYEGFGIPVLESLACNCPVVLPYNSSFPEVAGDAGVFYELNNGKDLLEKISNLIQDEKLRMKHIQLGREQVGKFSWDEAAKKCLELYKDAIFIQHG